MTTVHIPDPLVQRLEDLARREQRSLEELVIEILDRHVSPQILTQEQFAFIHEHHEEIMRAIVDHKRASISGDKTLEATANAVIDKIISSERYVQLFGSMGWDNVIDSYEDTPGYDNSLWMQLHEALQQDLEIGQLQRASKKSKTGKTIGVSLDEFRRRLDAE